MLSCASARCAGHPMLPRLRTFWRIPLLPSYIAHVAPAPLRGIFLAVDRPNVRRISIAIGAADTKLLLMRIKPLPKRLACFKALQTSVAVDAHEVRCNSAAIAAATAPTMIRAVTRGLTTACN